MKTLLTLFVLFFSSSVVADDISDFEIEGISIGDSLLDNYTIDEINNASETSYANSDKYKQISFKVNKNSKYEELDFLFKKDDKKYIIKGLTGNKSFDNNLSKCKEFKNSVIQKISHSNLFQDMEREDYEWLYETLGDGKSIAYVTHFKFGSNNQGAVRLYCTKWSDATKKEHYVIDRFFVEITSQEILRWLTNNAY